MSQSVALCFFVARPHFGRPWHCPGRNAWYIARRAAGGLGLLPPLDDRGDFRLGLAVTIASIRRHATHVPPVLLLTPEPMMLLPGVDAVIPVDTRPFEDAARCNFSMGGLSAYFKISLFGLEGWDRVVYFDSDIVALGDLTELWEPGRFAEKALYAVREKAEMGPWGESLGKLNTGVMVVNAPLLDRRVHARMLELARQGQSYDCGDQGIINAFLANRGAQFKAGELPEEYNVFVNDHIRARWPHLSGRAKILHFVGPVKPWDPRYERNCPFGREFKARWDEAARQATR
jgi:hypothetical protein